VREVVRGAKFILFNVEGASEGVGYELELVRSCGIAERTIITGRGLHSSHIAAEGAFDEVLALRGAGPDIGSQATTRLTQAIRALSDDAFRQTNEVADLSGLRCWVVDRQIDLAARSFEADTLAGIPYDLHIPSSLASN